MAHGQVAVPPWMLCSRPSPRVTRYTLGLGVLPRHEVADIGDHQGPHPLWIRYQ